MTVRAYGTWPAAIGSDVVARAPARAFAAVCLVDGGVRWVESRPAEGGRALVVERRDGVVADVTPPGFDTRTRVHEYGGGAVWYHGRTVFFSEFSTGRLYRQDGRRAEPVPIAPEPPEPNSLRYADGCTTRGGATVICVRERHEDGEVHNELVALAADGSTEPRTIASGHDFFAAPRVDPSGRRLSWLTWDHPRMPWDGTELWVAVLGEDGSLSEPRRVAGGPEEAILDPQWSPDGALHFCSDRTGWWNLYRIDEDGGEQALTRLEGGEIGGPAWVFCRSYYAFPGDGRIACIVTRAATDALELLEPESGTLEPAGLRWTSYDPSALAAGEGKVALSSASPVDSETLVIYDPVTGGEDVVRRALDVEFDPASISVPRAIEFPTGDGDVAHAFYYPPASGEWDGPAGERPPLRVICHGGPTSHSTPHLDLEIQYFTQRGIGVVDVNYRGSSGFGRAYRRLLNGRWGEIDWRDCASAARVLAEAGDADPDRTWVEGGSAGGYVVFCALVFEPHSFAAGVSLFGVSDAEALALETHKFESRYLDSMIGPYPERADLYRERSPIHAADRLERPMLLLQGLDDKIVLPSQAEAMVDVLDRKGIPHAYLAFEGEGHGFRREENVRRTIEATLGFVGRVFGFDPADDLELLEIAHL